MLRLTIVTIPGFLMGSWKRHFQIALLILAGRVGLEGGSLRYDVASIQVNTFVIIRYSGSQQDLGLQK